MKIVKYFAVGGMAATVDIGFFFLFTSILDIGWFLSALASFTLATAANYLLSIRYVFKSGIRFQKHHELMIIFLISGSGLAINQLILWMLIENQNLNMLASKITATALLFFWNYGLRKAVVFPELLERR
jgi:putative flippase GtrA